MKHQPIVPPSSGFSEPVVYSSIINPPPVPKRIYQNRKSTGTRWLWQQNEIPLPHNNRCT